MDLPERLEELTKADLLEFYKYLIGSKTVGFDYERTPKLGVIAKILSEYDADRLELTLTGWAAGDKPKEQTPVMPAEQTPMKPAEQSDAMKRLQDALSELVQAPVLDMETVKQLIRDEVAKQEPVIKKIILKDHKQIPIEGETHSIFDEICQRVNLNQPVLIVGASGCGKTHLGKQVADALGLEYGSISMSMGTSEADLFGRLLPTGENGKFEFHPSLFTKLYQEGGLFLIDEADAGDANLMLKLNSAIANGHFFLSSSIGNQYIKRHKDFRIIATSNTYGNGFDSQYSGREMLDGAFKDRFRANVVPMDYCPKLEKKLIDSEVLAWGHSIRQQIRSNKLRKIMSTRVLIDFTVQKQALSWGVKHWSDSYFADWTKDERSKVSV